jgi:hypothetical protein
VVLVVDVVDTPAPPLVVDVLAVVELEVPDAVVAAVFADALDVFDAGCRGRANGSRPRPGSRETLGVVLTLTAGRAVAAGPVAPGCGSVATGELVLLDFDSSAGTAISAATSASATGHSRLVRKSATMPWMKLIATVRSRPRSRGFQMNVTWTPSQPECSRWARPA